MRVAHLAAKRLALLAIGLLCLVLSGTAEQENPNDRKGFFIAFAGQTLAPRGDQSDGLTLWHFDKAFSVPRLESTLDTGLALGFRREGGLWELSVERANPRGTVGAVGHDVRLTRVELNGWGIPWKHVMIQPYYLLGLSLALMSVTDGARLAGSVSDAAYTGFGVNLGAGLLANFGRHLFLAGGVKYRWTWFFYVNGGGRGRDITKLTLSRNGADAFGRWLSAPSLGLSFSLGVLL
jgi:hypothetical protein